MALTWTVPGSTGGSAITGYDILRGTGSGGESTTPIATAVSGTTYTDSTAVKGTPYYYEVEAVAPSAGRPHLERAVGHPGHRGSAPPASPRPPAGSGCVRPSRGWPPAPPVGSPITGYDILRGDHRRAVVDHPHRHRRWPDLRT